jgi:hypothetical protein
MRRRIAAATGTVVVRSAAAPATDTALAPASREDGLPIAIGILGLAAIAGAFVGARRFRGGTGR